jgi:choline dehydrogenase
MSQGTTYDYIIVGGGSSACVVAARLVRDGNARVLLLERGPRKANPIMSISRGLHEVPRQGHLSAMHQTKPQPQLNGRGPIVPQGKVLGGGSTVNAMVYMRGQAADFDLWNELVTPDGQRWRLVLQGHASLFQGAGRQRPSGGEFHGVGGPLKISDLGHTSPMTRTYVKTLQGWAFPIIRISMAPNSSASASCSIRSTGRPAPLSAVDAFLAPVMNNPLLTIETEATVTVHRLDGNQRPVSTMCTTVPRSPPPLEGHSCRRGLSDAEAAYDLRHRSEDELTRTA